MAGEEGIEPTSCVLETLILPLNYSPIFGGWGGIRTHSPEGTDLQSAAALQLYRPPILHGTGLTPWSRVAVIPWRGLCELH